mgnify:CR=1 FL=1
MGKEAKTNAMRMLRMKPRLDRMAEEARTAA